MDSQWINQPATDGRNNYDQHNNDGNENLDLGLRLGLPDNEERNQANLAFQDHAGLNNGGPKYTQGPMGDNNIDINLLYAWPPSKVLRNAQMQPNVHGFAGGQSSGYSASAHTNFYMNPPNHPILPPSPTRPAMHAYTLIDVPSRRAGREVGNGSSISGVSGLGKRPRQQIFIDPNRRCTNYNCNTNDTPMWRRGPLGHNTLCNACGIKYRKEEDKRKAREVANNRSRG
ncbi:hypothetical protein ACOSQ4_033183 [Xanthoceras sorbifolium]